MVFLTDIPFGCGVIFLEISRWGWVWLNGVDYIKSTITVKVGAIWLYSCFFQEEIWFVHGCKLDDAMSLGLGYVGCGLWMNYLGLWLLFLGGWFCKRNFCDLISVLVLNLLGCVCRCSIPVDISCIYPWCLVLLNTLSWLCQSHSVVISLLLVYWLYFSVGVVWNVYI